MAKDYTKYNVDGVGENFNKRKLVFEIVKDYINKNKPSLAELKNVFPDNLEGTNGSWIFISKESDVKDPKRFNMKEPLTIKNGVHVVVSNQWGSGNLLHFISLSEKLGHIVQINSNKREVSVSEKDNKLAVEFIALFKNKSFDTRDLLKFINPAEELLKTYNSEIDEEAQAIDDVFAEIMVLTAKDPLLLGGYAYLFTFIAQKFDHWLDFNWDITKANAYKWEDMVSQGKNPVSLVCEESTQDTFKPIFVSRFLFTLMTICSDIDAEEMAEFIVSCDTDNYTFTSDDEDNFISDLVIDIIDVIGFNLNDYEVTDQECEIEPKNFLSGWRNMWYDYIKLSQDLINQFG
jgi:hypothetical protein